MFRARVLNKSLSAIASPSLMLVGAVLLLIGPMVNVQAQDFLAGRTRLQDSTVVSIDPPSSEVDVGDTKTVDVYIEDVTDLGYVGMLVIFDPALLEVVDADSDADGVQVEIGSFLGADVEVEHNDVDQDAGEIYVVQEVLSDTVSSEGVLATITFKGTTVGTSTITIDADELYLEDGAGEEITATIESGSITIVDVTSSPTPENNTPTPTEDALVPTRSPIPTSAPTASPAPTSPPVPTSEPTARPTATPEIKARVMEVWPDRSIGVASELLEGAAAHESAQVFSFGVLSLPSGEEVEARTYLHFPAGVFPLGTQVKQATLYVYVDSTSNLGDAAFGAYRVLEPWDTTGWDGDPDTWPALLPSPIAITEVSFLVEGEAGFPVPSVPKLAKVLSQGSPLSTPTPPSSGLPIPTLTRTADPTATSTPGSTPTTSPGTLTPIGTPSTDPTATTSSGTPTPRPTSRPGEVSTFELESMEGRWIMWDVTALLRAWVAKEVPDHGLALAAVAVPGSDSASDLILARSLTVDDPNTMPHIIADIEIHPVTPTPLPTDVPILPIAGGSGGGIGMGVMVIGVALLLLGLVLAAWRQIRQASQD